MKVLQVTTHINIGGIANYILTLSQALGKNGITSVVASSGGDLEAEFEKSGVSCRRLDIRTKSELSPKVFRAIFELKTIIVDEKIDIMHAHTRVSQVVSFFASKLTGVPYVTTCHGYFKTRARKIFDTWGARVIAISDAVAGHLKKDLGVREPRIALVYNGVEAEKFSKEYSVNEIGDIKRSLGLKGGPVIGTIGRLSPVKGHRYLIEAMPNIISGMNDVELLIVGNGPEETALKTVSRSLGLETAVRFIDASPDTPKFLAAMDVFVFPSVKEGLGIALLEALAAGRPCVASDIGGIGDVIRSGVSGLLVPVGDRDAVAGAVLKLLHDPELRRKMGERGRAVTKQKFSLDLMAEKVAALYKEVLK